MNNLPKVVTQHCLEYDSNPRPTDHKSDALPLHYRATSQYFVKIHRVSKNVPPLACYNFDAHEWSLIFFGRNVTDKVGNQKCFTMPPQVICAYALPGKMRKHENHIFHSTGLCYTHNAPVRYLPERNKLSSVMCLIASNIC